MVERFDFNSLEQPILEVVLPGAEGTIVRVTTPQEKLIERLLVVAKELKSMDTENIQVVRKVYSLVADLFNNNEDGLTFTAEDLRDKYKIRLEWLMLFIHKYMGFVERIQNAKN